MAEELQIEGFAAWALAAQLVTALLPQPVQSAVDLLTTLGYSRSTMPPIVMFDRAPQGGITANTEAFHIAGEKQIFITTFSATYKAALRGDQDAIKKLASAIAHEQVHVMQGADEREPYAKQIQVLKQLGASPSLISGVQQSMHAVAAQARK